MDDALSAFVERWRFKGPPYATSRDLDRRARAASRRPSSQGSIDDLFETITLYDHARGERAGAGKRPDGKYDVDLVVLAKKLRADGAGNEKEAPLDARGRHRRAGREGRLPAPREAARDSRARTASRCRVAGGPPRPASTRSSKLIDRDPSDNTIAVTR